MTSSNSQFARPFASTSLCIGTQSGKGKKSRYRTAPTYLNRLNSEADRIIAKSPQFIQILEYLEIISRTDSTVLLPGESCTGKEVLAKFIHKNSRHNIAPL